MAHLCHQLPLPRLARTVQARTYAGIAALSLMDTPFAVVRARFSDRTEEQSEPCRCFLHFEQCKNRHEKAVANACIVALPLRVQVLHHVDSYLRKEHPCRRLCFGSRLQPAPAATVLALLAVRRVRFESSLVKSPYHCRKARRLDSTCTDSAGQST